VAKNSVDEYMTSLPLWVKHRKRLCKIWKSAGAKIRYSSYTL